MILSPLAWQDLTLTYHFDERQTQPISFFDFQLNAQQSIDQFIHSTYGSLLVMKSSLSPEYIDEIQHYFSQHTDLPVVIKTEWNKAQLLGYTFFLEKENKIETVSGIIQAAEKGILILNLKSLLSDITQWDKLKQALLFGSYEPYAMNAIPDQLPNIQTQFKLILLGDREDISLLAEYDNDLYQFAQYTEIESYLNIDENNIEKWGNYIQFYANKYINKVIKPQALTELLQYFVRESESQELVSISPTLLKKHLVGIANFYKNQTAYTSVKAYFDALEEQAAVLSRYSLREMLSHQVYIETQNEEIGQINGLSVVEFDGVPVSFGEPVRISCNVQYGDGEITDIERKVELGGNIHSKGILIAQSCLANLLEFPTQLPFSASLAFEQSYGEIDGDSSSLAIFCVLISSLAKLPISQSLAITGSIDQFGNVLSVGGVNQKIEGFFKLCHARKLTGKQGVVIPAACLSHLSLHSDVIEAVKNQQFYIWAVGSVFEALEILFEHPFFDDEGNSIQNNKPALFNLIHHMIEQNQHSDSGESIIRKLWCYLKRN